MKMQFLPHVESEHWIKSLVYLASSIAIMALSIVTGLLKGSTLGVLIFASGAVLFFYAVPHRWGNSKHYAIEFALLFGLFSLLLIIGPRLAFWKKMMSEEVAWFLGGICLEAFVGTIAGIFVFSDGPRHLLYHAVTIILLTVFLVFPQCLFSSSSMKSFNLIACWVFMGIQLTVMAVLFQIASMKKTVSHLSRITLLIAAIILFMMSVWGLFTNNETHWMVGIRLWALLQIISGIIILYTFASISRVDET